MSKINKPFVMAIHWLDSNRVERECFSLKQLALDWFDDFCKQNKRPCVITFYCGVTPYWVYKKCEKTLTLSDADRLFRKGDVWFISLFKTNDINYYDVRIYDSCYKYYATIEHVLQSDFRMLRKVYTNVYYLSEELAEKLPIYKDSCPQKR